MRLFRIALLLALLMIASTSGRPQPTEKKSAACSSCTFLVNILHNLWGSTTLESCIGELVTYVCTTMKIEDNFVCKGIASEFKDEFVYVVGQIVVEPSEICGLFIADCGTFINPLVSNWHLEMPPGKPTHKALPPVQPGKPTMKVLHLTDLHIDRQYTPGLEAKCGEPQCCRPSQDPDEIGSSGRGKSVAADPVKVPAGKWGTLGDCDAPYWLFTNMLDHIAATHKDLDYVVVSGDLESHADWDYTRETHQKMIRNVSDSIRQRLPNLPVFFAVGNHEGVPVCNFAPHFVPEKYQMDWLYGTMADAWKGWVPADQDAEVRFNACYMRKLFPGLRLISLNNGLGDPLNFFLYINQTDPDGTLTWFMNQLWDAEKAGDKVHIVAHIPGGDIEAFEGWSINYYNIINRFEDTIVAQFFGHTHSEEYHLFYENPNDHKSRPTGVTWSAPSLTTYSEFFPAYRVYTTEGNFAGSNYQVIDWAEYYVDLDEANKTPAKDPVWKTLYPSVLDEYGLEDASPVEWSRLIDSMVVDDKIFQKYRKNFYRRVPSSACDSNCRNGFLCSARKSHHNETLCADIPSTVGLPRSTKRREPKPSFDFTLTKEAVLEDFNKFRSERGVRDDGKCPF